MWSLVAPGFRYRSATLAYAAGIALLLATAANLILPALGLQPAPNDDFRLPFLYPILILFAAIVVQFGWSLNDRREYRIVTQMLLPRTKLQIGLARIFGPSLLVIFSLLVAEALMFGIVAALGKGQEAWRFLFLAFFGGQFLLFLQLPLLVEEFQVNPQRSRLARVLFAVAILVLTLVFLLRALTSYVPFNPEVVRTLQSIGSPDPESLRTNLIVYALATVAMVTNLVLFVRRRSMVT